ncbi:MAG: ankyrin repeat domain-containing protein [Parvibaculum sp.]|nr:ankyrin repeat domain-containing protein [Parvibaculum sp.]
MPRRWAYIPFAGGLAMLAMLSCIEAASAIQPGGPANYIIDNDTVQAARTGDNETLREDLIKGISPNESGKDHIPMLILAAGSGHLSTVKLLLEYGADPDRRAPDRTTALTIASLSNRADIAEALLEAGANPDKPGANREVPLLIATRARSTAVVEILLRYGVDIGETDVTGRSALDLAEENHYSDISVLLRTVAR